MRLKKLKRWLRAVRSQDTSTTASATDASAKQKTPSVPSPRLRERQGRAQEPLPSVDEASIDRRTGTRPATSRKTSERHRPLSRQGIPLLRPDEKLDKCFLDAEASSKTSRHRGSAADAAPESAGTHAEKPRRSRTKARPPEIRRNRLGIRQLDDDAALWDHFLSGAGGESEAAVRAGERPAGDRPQAEHRSGKRAETDRHGIPRLDRDVDLHRFFEGAVADEGEAAELGNLLHRSLNHDARRLIKKKGDGEWQPRRLTLKEQLRRYPAPQAQLDLHGAVAPEARHRAEVFLRTAAADGLFTVRLIVGKGLHSEDGAVLPGVVEDLLLDLKRDQRILTYRWDKRLKRKSGALVVYLPPPF